MYLINTRFTCVFQSISYILNHFTFQVFPVPWESIGILHSTSWTSLSYSAYQHGRVCHGIPCYIETKIPWPGQQF